MPKSPLILLLWAGALAAGCSDATGSAPLAAPTDAGATTPHAPPPDAPPGTPPSTDPKDGAASPPTGDLRAARSCEEGDVQAALSSARAGDAITVPEGRCTWKRGVTLTRGVSLLGAGVGKTTIVSGDGATELVSIALDANAPVRVSGFSFENAAYVSSGKTSILVQWGARHADALTALRIDHNAFHKGTKCILTSGARIYGVVDHNTFVDCDGAVDATGDPRTWDDPIAAGTDKALFFEDNSFVVDNDTRGWGEQEQIMHGHGNRTVIRRNRFELAAYTDGNGLAIEAHGNGSCTTGGADDLRGMPILEIYENTIHVHRSYRIIYLRGGSNLVFGNTLTSDTGSPAAVELAEEEGEAGSPNMAGCRKTVWPAEDQVNNTFVWGNTLNGAPIVDVALNYATDPIFIKEGRDYFTHAPQSTGGKEVYLGRPGGAMQFDPRGPNRYYPYAPFPYPHPLAR